MTSKNNIQVAHRPGPFKQSNKPHKSWKSKNKKDDRGKQDVKVLSRKKKHELRRKERKHRLEQLRKIKREETMMKKRGLGVTNPILVVILSLHDPQKGVALLDKIKECYDDLIVRNEKSGHCHISSPRLKQRFEFIVIEKVNLYDVMDAVKVADVLLLQHALDPLDDFGEMLLSSILAHALPTTVHVVQGMENLNPKKKAEYKKNVTKAIETRFPDEKLHQADTVQELQLLLRQIGCQKQRHIAFRDARPHLLAENIEYVTQDDDMLNGILKVSGYIRGRALNVNGLVYIPGWGNFQMNQIDYENDPFPLRIRKEKNNSKDEDMALENVVLVDKAAPSEQVSLQSEVEPDPMENEQTWPTKEELDEATKNRKKVRKVAEGTSEYQAAWIIESEDEDLSDESDSESECHETMSIQNSEAMDYDKTEDESVLDIKEENYDNEMDMDEEKQMLVRFKEQRMNEIFPDEEDTPIDVSARVRFQKYRGLKNFSSAPWDPLENLPFDYARIYRFQSFKQTKKRVFNTEEAGAMPGMYVTLHIANVPHAMFESVQLSPTFVIFGLLPHEQKMSVMNVVIKKHATCETPIKSKDTLIFHVGYRRFICNPVFSEHKAGNKFKYERFLPPDTTIVASFFAPVMFPPASVVVFRQQQNGFHELVATGSLLDMNPNRVVVKRVVLSGHPFKILKRSAVVRYMFFNKDDINWFKCIELRTKCGRRGHIKESLGSHGHMKCVFDRQLQSQDVVLMSLYKRVFPKWTYDANVPMPVNDEEIWNYNK